MVNSAVLHDGDPTMFCNGQEKVTLYRDVCTTRLKLAVLELSSDFQTVTGFDEVKYRVSQPILTKQI